MPANTTNLYTDYVFTDGAYTEIVARLRPSLEGTKQSLEDALAKVAANPDSPGALAELQAASNNWSAVFNVASSIQRAVKDVVQGIIQKV